MSGSTSETLLAELMPLLVVVTGLQGTGKSTVADIAATLLGAPVLGHDWAMSALRPYPELQQALDAMEPPGHRTVGWTILRALGEAQLRRGCSVVLDGMAGPEEVEKCRRVADEEGATFVLILTECDDIEVHRSRIEGRRRAIPNWYELEWEQVERSRSRFEPPPHADLVLLATDSPERNTARLSRLLQELADSGRIGPTLIS